MLDDNLAMDRSRIQYVARLPHGETLVNAALNGLRTATQLATYRAELERREGATLKLRAHAVVAIGLERLVW